MLSCNAANFTELILLRRVFKYTFTGKSFHVGDIYIVNLCTSFYFLIKGNFMKQQTPFSTILFCLLLLLFVSCSKNKSDLQNSKTKSVRTYAESAEGLHLLFSDLQKAIKENDSSTANNIAGSLAFNESSLNKWLYTHFDSSTAARLENEWKTEDISMATKYLPLNIKMRNNEGKTNFIVNKFVDPMDPEANSYQMSVINAMRRKVPLYSLRITKPGKTSGYHLYNFVYVVNTFRFVGRMKKCDSDEKLSEMMDAVSELSHRNREYYFSTGKLPY